MLLQLKFFFGILLRKLSCKGYISKSYRSLCAFVFSDNTIYYPARATPTNVSAVFLALFFLPSLSPFQAVKVSTPTICLKDIQG